MMLQEMGLLSYTHVDSQFVPPRINNMYQSVISEVHKLRVTGLPSHPPLNEVAKEIKKMP